MELSKFGQKVARDPAIAGLMDDLGKALAGGDHVAMLGGGNPAAIEAVQDLFMEKAAQLVADTDYFKDVMGNYDPPRGHGPFITAVTNLINETYGWGITERNVVVTTGSQMGFFTLFNILAGEGDRGKRKILLPMVPEYIGYVDQGIEEDMFVTQKPVIHEIGEHEFKYGIDFDNLRIGPEIAAICVSRPTNPSGNVITNEELERLEKLAAKNDILLITDNAYGLPFPGVITQTAKPMFTDHMVHMMSLSKVGLPTARVGIMIAPVEVAEAVGRANVVLSLASPTFGQALAARTIRDGSLMTAAKTQIQPYYAKAAKYARAVLERELEGLNYRVHVYEGSYFFWLWLPGLGVSSRELYKILKDNGVIVVPGEYFFPGAEEWDWPHSRECLRINFARPKAEIDAGFRILGEQLKAII
jgi:valine--pyruvate aminotransferase